MFTRFVVLVYTFSNSLFLKYNVLYNWKKSGINNYCHKTDLGAQCNEQRDDCLIANAKCDKYKDCMCADGFVKDTKRQCIEGR